MESVQFGERHIFCGSAKRTATHRSIWPMWGTGGELEVEREGWGYGRRGWMISIPELEPNAAQNTTGVASSLGEWVVGR